MKSARTSLFKKIIIRFSVLVFSLLIVVSVVWVFFTRELLLRAGIPETKVLTSLFLTGRFMFILIIILLVVSIVLSLIFITGLRTGFLDLLKQITGLKFAPLGSRVLDQSKSELSDLADEVNNTIQKLENEINRDLKLQQDEHQHLIEEQSRVGFEQKKIYEEKIKLDYVMSRVLDGVILLSKNKNIVLLNKAAEELIGYKQTEAMAKPVSNVLRVFEEDRQIMPDEYAAILPIGGKDEAFSRKKVRIESSQATPKYVDFICVKLTLIQAQDISFMLILHDLTARLEIEKERTGLLSSFARELKHPFETFSDISARVQSDPSHTHTNLPSLYSGLGQLTILIDNLLTVTALEEGSISLSPSKVDLHELTNNCVSALSPIASERQVTLTLNSPADFPAQVTADTARLNQVVQNLLLNALNFSPQGGSVTVSFSQTESEIILQIQDTGIGIPTEVIKDLFTKFFVVTNDKNLNTGIGLGLYLSKKLIELQSGKIWLDSVEGRGTVASISLPKAN